MTVLSLENLSVKLGKRLILDNLTSDFSGRTVGLLGPNGAGKTTLINTLLGFYHPTKGHARLFGHDIVKENRKIRALVGYMPERDAFIAGMSCVGFVAMMAELSGLPPRVALERAHESLFFVGLGEARYRSIDTFSLGMKQMAKLAQAIVHGPQFIILDEPTNGLDYPSRKRMLELVRTIRDSGQACILLSSHLLRDVEESCEEIVILKNGKIVVQCNLEAERKANLKFIEIELGQPNGPFAEGLSQLGCEWALIGERRVKLVLPPGVEIRDLYQIAADRQLHIRRLNYKRDSLEDIFMKAMEATPNGSL